MSKQIVRLEGVSKKYGGNIVLKEMNMELEKGKFYTLLGPSGCGKTTILRLIAGFTEPTTGKIYINDQEVSQIPASKRRVNTVFQNYALFPHMNVYDNIAFGLSVKGVNKEEIEERVREVLKIVQLDHLIDRQINEMSGGQQQRIAIARAIINRPEILLLDEPLSALDHKLRVNMQYELRELQQQLGITFVFVTHDQEEALAVSDYIFVMREGQIVQAGSPRDIYDEPINHFVADFIGESNILKAVMVEDFCVEFVGYKFKCIDGGIPSGERVEVVIRPEDIQTGPKGSGQVDVVVDTQLFLGVFNEVIAYDLLGNEWMIHTTRHFRAGDEISLSIEPENIHVMRFEESEADFYDRLKKYEEVVVNEGI